MVFITSVHWRSEHKGSGVAPLTYSDSQQRGISQSGLGSRRFDKEAGGMEARGKYYAVIYREKIPLETVVQDADAVLRYK